MQQTNHIDLCLRNLVMKSFAIARWAYGAQAIGQDIEDEPPSIILINKTEDGSYAFRPLTPAQIVADIDRDDPHWMRARVTSTISDACARRLAMGFCDYVLAVQECGLFVGDEAKTKKFHKELEEFGSTSPHIVNQISKCCSFSLYDLSGVIARTYATENHCISTFLAHPDVDTLLNSKLEQDMSESIKDLENKWVYADDVPDEQRSFGPLDNWEQTLSRVLDKITNVDHFH